MKVVLAPQSFKGTASAAEVSNAMYRGVRSVSQHVEIVSIPIADGGSGTVEALVSATRGHYVSTLTKDPLNRPITAYWGVLGDGETAIIETAAASGLALLDISERDPTKTTSRGTGSLMRAALDVGHKRILIGLGDSATNDAGVGLAQALGVRAMDIHGHELSDGGEALTNLNAFDMSHIHPNICYVDITVLCDVTNPLCGLGGASFVFGPQKGASINQIKVLDAALGHFADVVEGQFGHNIRDIEGSGAAGGLGAGLVTFCGAVLRPGFDIVSEVLNISESLVGTDLVLTGEGRLDAQTANGKGVAGVASLAKKCGVPLVIAVVGGNELNMEEAASLGIDGIFTISDSSESSIVNTEATLRLIESTTFRVVSQILSNGKRCEY